MFIAQASPRHEAPAGQECLKFMEIDAPSISFEIPGVGQKKGIRQHKSMARLLRADRKTISCKRARLSKDSDAREATFASESLSLEDRITRRDSSQNTRPGDSTSPRRPEKRLWGSESTSRRSLARRTQQLRIPRDWAEAEFSFRWTSLMQIAQDRFPESDGWVHKSEYKPYECEPGTVFFALWMKPLLDESVRPGDKTRVETSHGPLIVKTRPFVVLWINNNHISALPIYTYSGRGIAGLSPELRREHVRILNHGEYLEEGLDQPKDLFPGNHPVGIDPKTTDENWSIAKGSAVNFTQQENIDLKTPILPRARLHPECTKNLMRLTIKHMRDSCEAHERFLQRMGDL